jgi:hypothetical protein
MMMNILDAGAAAMQEKIEPQKQRGSESPRECRGLALAAMPGRRDALTDDEGTCNRGSRRPGQKHPRRYQPRL